MPGPGDVRMGGAYYELWLKQDAVDKSLIALEKRFQGLGKQFSAALSKQEVAPDVSGGVFSGLFKFEALKQLGGKAAQFVAEGFESLLATGSFKQRFGGSLVDALDIQRVAARKGLDAAGFAQNFQKAIYEATQSTDFKPNEQGGVLGRMGLDPQQLSLKPIREQMLAVGGALEQIANPADRAAAAIALFGRAGTEVIPFLAELRKSNRGFAMTEGEIKRAIEQAKAIKALKQDLAEGGEWAAGKAAGWAKDYQVLTQLGWSWIFGGQAGVQQSINDMGAAKLREQRDEQRAVNEAKAAGMSAHGTAAQDMLKRVVNERSEALSAGSTALAEYTNHLELAGKTAAEIAAGRADFIFQRIGMEAEAAATPLEKLNRRLGELNKLTPKDKQSQSDLTKVIGAAVLGYIGGELGVDPKSIREGGDVAAKLDKMREARRYAETFGLGDRFGGMERFGAAIADEERHVRRGVGVRRWGDELARQQADVDQAAAAGAITADEARRRKRDLAAEQRRGRGMPDVYAEYARDVEDLNELARQEKLDPAEVKRRLGGLRKRALADIGAEGSVSGSAAAVAGSAQAYQIVAAAQNGQLQLKLQSDANKKLDEIEKNTAKMADQQVQVVKM